MPEYRRWYVPGGTYFFTLVSYQRQPFLCRPTARRLLREAIQSEQARRPFEIRAIALLPDHLHTIWALPAGDDNYSMRWSAIKAEFTRNWLEAGGWEGPLTPSKQREERRGVWQPRFMEHSILDEDDFESHFDYIHYNPVKHGYVNAPRKWAWSTFHKYVKHGVYESSWGSAPIETPLVDEGLIEWVRARPDKRLRFPPVRKAFVRASPEFLCCQGKP